MTLDFNETLKGNSLSEIKELFQQSKIGFEKESLRVLNSSISNTKHPELLGSSLCNQYITTDFSEAQLELVTPPFENQSDGMQFLNDLHHFVHANLDNEFLWPLSIPAFVNNDEDVVIADYGISNIGQFKSLYRNGLSFRYGRIMQAISGLHFNYSLPEDIWNLDYFMHSENESSSIRSLNYFNILRNLYRFNWLILYLFGSSPILTKGFIKESQKELIKIDNETFYMPYGTSLRMSEYGYCNPIRSNLQVSINSLDEYISDLHKAVSTYCSDYKNSLIEDETAKQISQNILQIDDEYYAIARAKSNSISDESTIKKLSSGGVDFIELRSLDLNPFSPIGIDLETTLFLETLMLFCLINEDGEISKSESQTITSNDRIVSKFGRKPKIMLKKDSKEILLTEWGKQIIDSLYPIADLLDSELYSYTKAISAMSKKLDNPELTISGRLLDDFFFKNKSYSDYGITVAESNKKFFSKLDIKQNKNWDKLVSEADESLRKQKDMEKSPDSSFEDFLNEYFERNYSEL